MNKCECLYCGESFNRPHSQGPKPLYCRPSHRQRAYELREWQKIETQLKGAKQ